MELFPGWFSVHGHDPPRSMPEPNCRQTAPCLFLPGSGHFSTNFCIFSLFRIKLLLLLCSISVTSPARAFQPTFVLASSYSSLPGPILAPGHIRHRHPQHTPPHPPVAIASSQRSRTRLLRPCMTTPAATLRTPSRACSLRQLCGQRQRLTRIHNS